MTRAPASPAAWSARWTCRLRGIRPSAAHEDHLVAAKVWIFELRIVELFRAPGVVTDATELGAFREQEAVHAREAEEQDPGPKRQVEPDPDNGGEGQTGRPDGLPAVPEGNWHRARSGPSGRDAVRPSFYPHWMCRGSLRAMGLCAGLIASDGLDLRSDPSNWSPFTTHPAL